jgi:hypothetical protein
MKKTVLIAMFAVLSAAAVFAQDTGQTTDGNQTTTQSSPSISDNTGTKYFYNEPLNDGSGPVTMQNGSNVQGPSDSQSGSPLSQTIQNLDDDIQAISGAIGGQI